MFPISVYQGSPSEPTPPQCLTGQALSQDHLLSLAVMEGATKDKDLRVVMQEK